ncbi:hypothetical protein NY751_20345 [Xanthomonas campestris]|uniref:hypothetical protein n=1 Tax=Xanthomonas campestris TaxID=339 RepID=UPI002358B485|nr:hypothetical protein [Xanthomonas campestris]MDC8748365.1 hypothetical protein [Xanthomonas campestris]
MAEEIFFKKNSNDYKTPMHDALLQFGSDMTIAVAMGSFGAVLGDSVAAEMNPGLVPFMHSAALGGSGIWAGIAIERFFKAVLRINSGRAKAIAFFVSALALLIGISAVFAVITFTQGQKIASLCDRAEQANSPGAAHPKCIDYLAARALSDSRVLKR